MKILILTPNFKLPGGVKNFIQLLGEQLKKNQIEIKYFFVGNTDKKYLNLFYPFLILYQLIKFKKEIRTYNPDLVHINPSLNFTAIIRDFIFLKITKNKGYPILFFIHGWRKNISDLFNKKYLRKYFKKRFRLADKIIVLSEQFKNELISLGINSDKIKILSTMVKTTDYIPKEKDFSPPFEVLFCSAMNKTKGPYELIKAIPDIIKKNNDIYFTFMGDGKELSTIKNYVQIAGLNSNVSFTGYITGKEKINIFKRAHLFILPSYSEGFPTVVLEAMAAGLPVIVTPVGGLINAIKHNKHGIVLSSNPPDPKEIEDSILFLLDSSELMQKISDQNITEVKEKYDLHIVTEKIIKIYNLITKN